MILRNFEDLSLLDNFEKDFENLYFLDQESGLLID